MPQAVVGVFKAAFALVTATGIKGFIARTVGTILLSLVTSRLFGPKVPEGVGFTGLQTTSRSALEFRKIVYGQAMVSGPIVYNNTASTNNQDLWYVIALAKGQSDDLVSVWFDGDEIPKADINWTAGTGSSDGTGTGAVSTAKWVGASSTTAVWVWYYLGDEDQPAAGAVDSAFNQWTSSHRLRGVTYIAVRLRYIPNTERVWEEGAPENIKAVIKGRRIYDPRLDSTNGGSGSHRYTDASTWEWSDNPSLCVADYLMNYMGVDPATGINWTSVADAADDCEVLVPVPPAASPQNTQQRFKCNGVISLGETHKDNLESILSSMDGSLSYSGGRWKVRASVWEASSATITADDIVGDVEVRGSAPRSDRFNTVRGYYVDPSRDYQPAEFHHVTASEFRSRDNDVVLEYDLELPCTNNEFMAQRIAYRLLEKGDNQVVAKLVLNKIGANIAVGDVVSVTLSELSWNAKTFRVINWKRTSEGLFEVTLREDGSGSYDDPLVSDYTTESGGIVNIPATVVPPTSGLSATSIPSGIRLSWTNPGAGRFDTINVYDSANSSWGSASLKTSVRASTVDILYEAGTTRWFWVRAQKDGRESLRDPNNDTSSVTATAGAVEIETPVVTDATDGNSVYTSGTQPRVEGNALDEDASFTSPSNIDTRCLVQWTAQSQISNTTSGVATGESRLQVRVTVDGTPVHQKYLVLEGYTTTNGLWGQIAGSISVAVPAGDEVVVAVTSFRNFSTSGTSPAQTHYWQNVLLTITPQREAVT